MGIGIAFATGFLKGHTDYTKEQAALAQKEKEAQAEKNKMFFEQGMDIIGTKELSEGQYNLGLKMIEASGFKGLDLAGISNTLATAGDTTRLGSVILPFEENLTSYGNATQTLYNFESWLTSNGDKLAADMAQDANLVRDVRSFAARVFAANNTYYFKELSGTNDKGVVTAPAYRDYDVEGTKNFYRLLTGLGILGKSKFRPGATYAGEDELPANSFLYPMKQGQDGGQAAVVSYDDLQMAYGVPEEGFAAVANQHGMEDTSQLWTNTDYLLYSSDEGMQIDTIANGAKLLAANAPDLLLLEGAASESTLNNTVQVFNAIGGSNGDIGAMRRAAYTIVRPDPTFETAPPSTQTFVSGSKFMKDRGYKIDEFRTQQTANDESVEMLLELRRIQAEYGRSGLVMKLERFGLGVIGQGKQLVDLFGGGPEYADFGADLDTDSNTTRASLMAIAQESLGIDNITAISKMDALRLTLAAKMARAVDPSGRLSDQDFKIQLDRLGGTRWFSNTEGELDKLDTVIEEFQNRQREMKTIGNVIAKENITVEDRRFLKATRMVNVALRHAKKMRTQGGGTDTAGADAGKDPEPAPGVLTRESLGIAANAVPDASLEYVPDPTLGVYSKDGKNYVETPDGMILVKPDEINIK